MKSKKWLIGSAIMTAAVVTAVVPAQSPAEAATTPITEVVYNVGGKNVSVSFDYYTEAVNVGVLKNPLPQYLKLSDGKYYALDDFTSATNISNSLEDAINLLTTDNLSVNISVVAGDINPATGEVISDEVVTSFEVISID